MYVSRELCMTVGGTAESVKCRNQPRNGKGLRRPTATSRARSSLLSTDIALSKQTKVAIPTIGATNSLIAIGKGPVTRKITTRHITRAANIILLNTTTEG